MSHPDGTARLDGTAQPSRRRSPLALALTACLGASMLTAVAATPAHAAVSDGLVLEYRLDETSGTTATDASGNGRNGVVNGTAGWGGAQGLTLDGSSTYVKLPNNVMNGLSSISVATDVWVDANQGTPYFIYGFGNTTNSTGNGYLMATGNVLRASIASGNWTTEQNTQTSYALARGGWKHLAYTQTGGTGILYEDGVEVARNTAITLTPGSIGNGTTTADYIGKSDYSGDLLLKGKIRDFRIYNRALAASEVGELAGPAATEALVQETSALTLGNTTAVTSNLTLPATGSLGAKITWASSAPGVVDPTGAVTRPAAGSPNATATLTATLTKDGRTATKAFPVTVLAQANDPAVAQAAAAALVVHGVDDVRGNLTLPTTGDSGSTVTWASSDPSVITTTGEVTRPATGAAAATVTLTATVTYHSATVTRQITATVPALPAPAAKTGYMFSYFTGEGTATGEQIHFALSKGNDALNWRELNGGNSVLTSSLGEKGVRDPFITRSPAGDRFYLIATDLRIFNGNGWDASQRTGSKSLAVWESTDLVHWSDERLVKVSPDTAGNTWAPEAFWDPTLGAYVVYWASKIYDAADTTHSGNTYNKMMYATTRDFWTFSEPKIWKDPGYSVIDSTVTENNGTFYRFTKDERNNSSSTPCSKYIIEEKSTTLLNTNWNFVKECIGSPDLTAGEGPTIFKSNTEQKWYLFIDEFGGRGYVPFSSTDLDAGTWTMEKNYSLPASPRHGTVMPVTQAEYQRLLSSYLPGAAVTSIADSTVDTVAGTAPVLPAMVNVTHADGTTGTAAVTWDAVAASAYAAPGTFTVLGSIADGSVRAKVTVTVAESVPGLVLRYTFDEGGGTVAKDTSGHGFNGSYVNSPAFGTGVKNGDLVLSGGAGGTAAPYVSIPNGVLAGASDITVSAWVKWTSSTASNQWLFGLGTGNTKYLFSSPNYSSSTLRAGITTGSYSSEQAVSSSGLTAGSWQHVTVTINSATHTEVLYVNGTAVATNTSVTLKPSDLYDAAQTVSGYIGRSFYSPDPYLGAAIDDFRIYNTALAADDVAVLAGNTAGIRSAAVTGQKADPIVYDSGSTVTLPMTPGTAVTALAPTFTLSKGATISPASGSTHDFTSPVTYTVTGADGTSRTWTVRAVIMRTPVLPGLNADPNIAVFGDTYWIYPTSDGFDGWSATQFHAFSSKDLVNWTDHGVILDLGPDVSWADKYAWAPTIATKNGKYYFYFCAEQNIGVAVADSPAGPFKDALGKPLVAKGLLNGQMIDPQVFQDDDGSNYLYWGNGAAYVVKLNDDMTSFDPGAVKTITPNGYNEGSFVFKRKGIYYLSWSENDTRDENYRVAYAVGTSPYGPWSKQGVILSKDLSQGIKGTGHHSVIQVPGTDEWYIAYHRFAIPDGDGMHRETTVDRLTFNTDNTVAPVVPTLTGVAPRIVPDLTPPVASASVAPAAPASGWYRTGPVSVTVTGVDDRDPTVTTQVKVTGPGFDGLWAPLSGALSLTADGVYTVDYRAVDTIGNTSAVRSLTVKIDGTPGVSKAGVDTAARTVTLTAADALSGVARVEYTLNGSAWTGYSGPIAVGKDRATVTYRTVDTAGNVESDNTVVVPGNLATSTVTATVAPTTIVYGTAAKATVKVGGNVAKTTPTGTVRVLAGAVEVGSGTLDDKATAKITLSETIPVGSNGLTVLYSGDGVYAASSTTLTLTVVKSSSQTHLALSPDTVKVGRTDTVSVRVKAATHVPTDGTVTVRVTGGGWDTTYTGQLDADGLATLTVGPFTKPGAISVVADYHGSGTVDASVSDTMTLTVKG